MFVSITMENLRYRTQISMMFMMRNNYAGVSVVKI